MEHKGTKRIETERLLLRPFTPEDAPAMYRNWASDSVVTEYLTWKPHVNLEATQMMADLWAEKSQNPDYYQWAIVLRESGEPIGSLSVVRLDDSIACAELGWCIGRQWWGRGLMPEAAWAVTEYLIREVGFHRVAARHDVRNAKSGRVMQKIGMIREGVLRAAVCSNAGIGDEAVYSILASEL